MKASIGSSSRTGFRGFTLVEVLVGVAILAILMVVIFSVLSMTARAWTQSSQRLDTFQNARVAFDQLTRMLSQATLNVYWDYDDPNAPTVYRRQSELAFAVLQAGSHGLAGEPNPGAGTGHGVFFQIPVGATAQTSGPDFRPLSQTLTSVGFSVRYVSDAAIRPPFIEGPENYRLRLMQYRTLSEDLNIYEERGENPLAWISGMEQVPLADNIIFLAIWPRLSTEQDPAGTALTSDYTYNSRANAEAIPQPSTAHQLPPTVQVTMIAIDEKTAERLPRNDLTILVEAYAGTLRSVEDYEKDIEDISARLSAENINFRIFTTTVQLRESRWSP